MPDLGAEGPPVRPASVIRATEAAGTLPLGSHLTTQAANALESHTRDTRCEEAESREPHERTFRRSPRAHVGTGGRLRRKRPRGRRGEPGGTREGPGRCDEAGPSPPISIPSHKATDTPPPALMIIA